MLEDIVNYIESLYNGKSKGFLEILNPSTNKVVASIPNFDIEKLPTLLPEAEKAMIAWQALTADERSSVLVKAASKMRSESAALSQLMSLEQGKTLKEAAGEIEYAASFFQWFGEEARRIKGSWLELAHDKEVVAMKQSVGICAAITPWNFPSAMITRKAGAAIAAGCAMLVKPAPDTPLSAFAVQRILIECGAPAGLLQIVSGDAKAIGEFFCSEKRIRKLSFTGSTQTGKLLMAQCASTLKKLTLELGGNSPFIIFDDADLQRAAADLIFGKFRNGGQACTSINRIFVHKNIKDTFVDSVLSRVKDIVAGDGLDSKSSIGPLINCQAVQKVKALVEDAIEKGSKLLHGTVPVGNSQIVQPIVIANIPHTARMFSEEIFGPVIALYDFSDEGEVLQSANNTDYGLAAYLYTSNLNRANRMTKELQYGMVGVNEVRIQVPPLPFGGVKFSGFGKEGGSEGIEEYLVTKAVCTRY